MDKPKINSDGSLESNLAVGQTMRLEPIEGDPNGYRVLVNDEYLGRVSANNTDDACKVVRDQAKDYEERLKESIQKINDRTN